MLSANHAAVSAPPVAVSPVPRDHVGLLAFPGTLKQAERDTEIVAPGHTLNHCLQVVEGCVRIVYLLEDGRRQITDFLFPGDVLGLDALPGEGFAAEAVTPVTVRRIPRAMIQTRASTDLQFARRLLAHGAAQIRAARNRCILLGRKTALERVASFLLEMEDRTDAAPGRGVALPMSRTDMADYLGLTTETVCRALTELRRRRVIRVERTSVVILDRPALELAGSEYVH